MHYLTDGAATPSTQHMHIPTSTILEFVLFSHSYSKPQSSTQEWLLFLGQTFNSQQEAEQFVTLYCALLSTSATKAQCDSG